MSLAAPPGSSSVWPAVRMVARADIGQQRLNNEDAVGIHPQLQPWPAAVLADGMGGYNAGEVASSMAVDLIAAAVQHCSDSDDSTDLVARELTDALHMANTAIYAAAQSTPGCSGMGTTVVAALVLASEVLIAHLGDSRAYAWRAGRLQRLTRDHSLVQQDIDAGLISEADARTSSYGHLVTRALGVMPQVDPELSHWLLQQGDRILLCSDGLTDMLSDASLESLFDENLPLARLLEALIEAANAAGGKDNIGVVLIEQDA